MITFVEGDITKASTQVIAHQVNCNGVMGGRVLLELCEELSQRSMLPTNLYARSLGL